MTQQALSKTQRTRRSHKLLALIGAALMAGAPISAFAQDSAPTPKPPMASTDNGSQASQSESGKAKAKGEGEGRHMAEHRGHRRGWQHGNRGHRGMGRHYRRMMREMHSPAKLAAALSTIETGIGITPDQMAVWRTFTGAFVAFSEGGGRNGQRSARGGREDDAMMSDADTAPSDDADTPDMTDDQAADASDGYVDMESAQAEADAMTGDDSGGPDATGADTDLNPGTASSTDEAAEGEEQSQSRMFRFVERMADRAIDKGQKAEALKSALGDLETTLTPQQVETARGLIRSMAREARQEFRMERGMKRGMRRGHRGGHHGMHRGDHRGHHGQMKGHRHHGERQHGERHDGNRPGRG